MTIENETNEKRIKIIARLLAQHFSIGEESEFSRVCACVSGCTELTCVYVWEKFLKKY